jgi:hypothetical protein
LAFELYEGTRGTTEAEEVSITATGNIVISPRLTEKYFSDAEFVELYFDAETRRIGIKPLKKETEHSLRLNQPAKSKRKMFSGRGLLKSHKLFLNDKGEVEARKHIPATVKDGMIVFSAKSS